jgi:hypothetical protein
MLGTAISAGIENYAVAIGVTPMISIPMMLCAGLIGSTDRVRPYWNWVEKLSVPRFGYIMLMTNEMQNIDSISCDVAKYGPVFCAAQPKNGTQALTTMKLDGNEISEFFVVPCSPPRNKFSQYLSTVESRSSHTHTKIIPCSSDPPWT